MYIDSENKKVIDFYTKEAEKYDDIRYKTDRKRYVDRIEKNIISDMIGECKNKSILEIGCGTGRFSIYLSNQGSQVTALDPVLPMLKKLNNKKIQNANLINASGYELPFKKNTFNGCICLNVLNHLPNYQTIFYEVKRILKPDGFFIFNFSNLFGTAFPYALWINFRKRSGINDVYTRWDNLLKIRNDLSQVGFVLNDINGCFPTLWGKFDKNSIFWLEKLNGFSKKSFIKYMAVTLFIKTTCEKN